MRSLDQASLRVLRWRAERVAPRLAQLLVIAPLVWLATHTPLVLIWVGVAGFAALVDAQVSRRLLARLEDRRLGALSSIARAASALSFSSVCFILLMDRTGFGLAGPLVVACAMTLNNVVMTRGSRRFAFSLVAPAAACLIVLPLAAWTSGHPLTLTAALLLTAGCAGYVVFIVLLAAALFREHQALTQALDAAEAASRAKSSFLAVTSHEIRTPLNGVLGMAQAMAGDPLPDVQRQRVEVIRQSGEALLTLLNDMLDLAKIEAGKLELESAAFDLERVVRSAFDAFTATAVGKGLAYGLAFDPAGRGLYEGDPARLRQVVCNLISNAVKFTASGEVIVTVSGRDESVRIAVRDTGPGLPEGFSERLFDKFTQADASTTRRFGGTGLGLAICRELTEAMNGRISAENAPNGGAVFTVELPLRRQSAEAPDEPAPSQAAGTDGGIPAGVKVLAAEDNPVNQVVLRTLLEQIGAEATLVDNGAEAVAAWEAGEFDLMLMDVQMPVMDGPEAARRIRELEAGSGRARTPIIALTANVMSHQLEAYTEAGMDGVVGKPIAVAELYAAIAEWAGRGGSHDGSRTGAATA